MKIFKILILFVIIGLSNISLAKQIEITSNKLEVDENLHAATFSGNVVAKEESMVVKSERMVAHYGKGERTKSSNTKIEYIDFLGGVVMTTPKGERVSGKTGKYDLLKKVITVESDVVLTQKGNIIKGEKLTYNVVSETAMLSGKDTPAVKIGEEGEQPKKDGERVKVIINKEEGNGRSGSNKKR